MFPHVIKVYGLGLTEYTFCKFSTQDPIQIRRDHEFQKLDLNACSLDFWIKSVFI